MPANIKYLLIDYNRGKLIFVFSSIKESSANLNVKFSTKPIKIDSYILLFLFIMRVGEIL